MTPDPRDDSGDGCPGATATRSRPVPPADLAAAAVVLALVGASVAGTLWWNPGRQLGPSSFKGAPENFGEWPILGTPFPHTGPGTVPAVLLALLAVLYGPTLSRRLPWRRALLLGYITAVGWITALALVDGWQSGFAKRLTPGTEYLAEVPGITDIPAMLAGFVDRIAHGQADSWTVHVAGHPPGATLVFVWLDRVGLGGGVAASVVCVLAGALVAVAVPATVSLLGHRDSARTALPLLVLFPGAVWLGVSADALFAGVTATGIALLALAAVRHAAWALPAGAILGFGIFLSYGLITLGAIAFALVLVTRAWRAFGLAVAGALVVVGVFALAGFWWLDGYHAVVDRYYDGIGADRPYSFWVWANLGCLALATGPAIGPALRRAACSARTAPRLVAVIAGAVVTVAAADLSGLSKAEVERIWLPFAVWLLAATALLPARSARWWLACQAATALAVNHLFLTNW
ncbi:hypothetical protein GCM10009676_06140 [Prauserella halophila]|uniref:Integral membrane protein n=1 Tax=Prauserella halophila TaxID=185641 RepID=A0ABN1VXS2_9PSEU|nr:hypothetical protein [Prauserella halophila]MCP2237336.1 hypothetical protein [Prauserella halophila]